MTERATDQNRRIESVVRIGVINAVDHARPAARVKSGDILTDWLPWREGRAGDTRDWDPPTVGEQCLLLSPSGETAAGIILTGINCDAHPAPSNDPNKTLRLWKDGARLEYDHGAHEYLLDVPVGGKITLHIGSTTLVLENGKATLTTQVVEVTAPISTFIGNVAINGTLAVNGAGGAGGGDATFKGSIHTTEDVVAGTISLQEHVHGGIQTGGSDTDKPK